MPFKIDHIFRTFFRLVMPFLRLLVKVVSRRMCEFFVHPHLEEGPQPPKVVVTNHGLIAVGFTVLKSDKKAVNLIYVESGECSLNQKASRPILRDPVDRLHLRKRHWIDGSQTIEPNVRNRWIHGALCLPLGFLVLQQRTRILET
ncbi:hypothetical protein L596_018261 [Steinernema carpocapsae]|uniref:Uncharacterized protein n=1 Tax=Steinernema carpocapsae TaxID=34508 RepID=A0A4U5N4V6_STECR|nr:hypothetical protein L596_018261 [Steinernema carpocapsae]